MKKIYLVIQTSRVNGTNEKFKNKEILYACDTKEHAEKEVEKLNNDKTLFEYLEFKYEIEEIILFRTI